MLLHASLGACLGGSAVAVFYELVLRRRSSSFTPPPPATPLQQQQPTHQATDSTSRFPNNMLPTASDIVYVAPGDAYVSAFSSTLRTPRWVLEVIEPKSKNTTTTTATGDRSSSKFFSNETIPEPFRATNADYAAKHGLSRGHLAAAQFHKGSQLEMDATFDLAMNIVPQDMTVNACDWFRLEQMQKKLAKDFARLFVLTGPAFVPKQEQNQHNNSKSAVSTVEYEVVGDHQVAVPTHVWKCLLGEKVINGASPSFGLGCFMLPNAPILEEKPMTAYQVPVECIESLTGIRPFLQQRQNRQTYPLCQNHKCEGSYGSFSRSFRAVGQLRAAKSRAELDARLTMIAAEHAGGDANKLDSSISKEYQLRSKNLI